MAVPLLHATNGPARARKATGAPAQERPPRPPSSLWPARARLGSTEDTSPCLLQTATRTAMGLGPGTHTQCRKHQPQCSSIRPPPSMIVNFFAQTLGACHEFSDSRIE